MPIIASVPRIFTLPQSHLTQSLEAWRECQFGERRLQDLIIKHPNLILHGDSRKLRDRINFLQTFVSTPKNCWKLIMSNPNLVVDGVKEIEDKFNYLMKKMKIEAPEITKTEVFRYSLDHIKMRHIFLVRLGMFKVRTEKAIENNERNTNLKLSQIVDTSDKKFATKLCHVTLEEYDVFQELLRREWKRDGIDDELEDFDEFQNERGIDQN